ncbi:glutamate-1-semialdehyde 2,1-aminomutase [Desulfatibacillum aliphaticivorans]|uniref:glutamate-1-semialdehyde 2,1-aminomutase n=1 Tax=Desulfatibacillum aliphaticivorans TaxID=218208 RepID=UPI000410C813|nr:glutamate-1-semialdehyde 2,1-aminomutase [Desulfatibacillum aliphaticivorans]
MEKSKELFARACKTIPGGVNSPVRACGSVGTDPCFIARGQGSAIFDADGKQYIDYIGSWGPLILGHRHPAVIKAIEAALANGCTFGAPTELEIDLAEAVVNIMPSVEMVRMVNSGTEATMSAVRLARGATGRDGIVKFDGCYHGHGDSLLVAAGSGVATLGIPGSPGVPDKVAESTASLEYNNIEAVKEYCKKKGDRTAAIIVEPVAGNMGVVAPKPEFIQGLREVCDQYGIVLILDEVMTGFRVALGGAQSLYGVTPDLTTMGKVIGGGLPVGAYGGKRSLMEKIAPSGPVYQAGTLSGNPMAMAAGIATLKEISQPGFYEALEKSSQTLADGLKKAAADAGVEAVISRVGSMQTLFFSPGPVENFEDAKKCDLDRFSKFYQGMRDEGVFLPPSQFEAWFVSSAHTEADIEATLKAAEKVLRQL